MKYLLTIADHDEDYSSHFINYITEKENKRVKANYITSAEYLEKALGQHKSSIDILLISGELYCETLDYSNVKTLILLSDGRIGGSTEVKHILNKYQAADVLINEIIKIYLEENPYIQDASMRTGTCSIIGFYSAVSKCGKTLSAVTAAKSLAQNGKKVLYLNLESYPATEAYFPIHEKNQFADVLYFAKERKNNFIFKMMGRIDSIEDGKLFYFSPPLSAEDLRHTPIDAWNFIFHNLRNNSEFDYVIVDFPSSYDEVTMMQLELCDGFILLISSEAADCLKTEGFFRTLKLMDSELQRQPHAQILNQYQQGLSYDVPAGMKGIPYIPDLVNKNTWPYQVHSDSVMGRILCHTISSFTAG